MSSFGIRILDKKDRIVTVKLFDILEMIDNGNALYWSIIDLEATGDLGEKTWAELDEIENLEKGLLISWKKLVSISKNFWDIWDLTLVASRNSNFFQECKNQNDLCKSCDLKIVMFDSSYWEVFSKDSSLIDRLAKQFKDIEILIPNRNNKH